MERSNFPCHSSSRPLVPASALAHGKTCDHHICICLQSRRRHNDISAKAHWRRTNRTDALRRDNFFCFCVIACMRLCMCVCVRAHLCVRACKDCLTPICVGNVICDLEEMELSLIDPLMLFFLRSSLPHLLQQEANTASRLPALKAQGKKKKRPLFVLQSHLQRRLRCALCSARAPKGPQRYHVGGKDAQ